MDTKRSDTTGTIDMKDITIGVELEMILFNLPHSITNVLYGELEFISNALEELATQMGVMRIIDGIYELNNLKSQDTSIEEMEQQKYKERHFQIKDDISIKPIHPINKDLEGRSVEVCTPILTQNNWESTLRSLCTAITTGCDKSGATVLCNDSCGLHVHIGLGRDYTVREVKQLSKAITLFERQMDHHHPPHRSPPPPSRTCSSMITSNLANHALRGLTPAHMIWRIDDQIDLDEVLCVINGRNDGNHTKISRYYKYNLTCVLTYKTVEFRQAAGTLDADWIIAWVKNICKFVTAASATEDEEWYEWAENAERSDGIVTDVEICRRFGLPEGAETHQMESEVDEVANSLLDSIDALFLDSINALSIIGED